MSGCRGFWPEVTLILSKASRQFLRILVLRDVELELLMGVGGFGFRL